MSIRRVMVTGATGLLGSHIVQSLVEQGFEVNALVRSYRNHSRWQRDGVQVYHGNLCDREHLYLAMQNCQAVIHAAADTSPASHYYRRFKAVNVDPTSSLIDLSLQMGMQRFIFISTANCFAFGDRDHPGNEEKPAETWTLRSGYIKSKLQAQQLVLQAVKDQGLPAIIMNPTFLLGNEEEPRSSNTIFRPARLPIIPTASGGKNFVDVRHVANTCIKGLHTGEPGECFLLAGVNASYREFYLKVLEIQGKQKPILVLPSWLLRTFGWVVYRMSYRLGQPTSINPWNMRLISSNAYYSNSKARNLLNLPASDLEEMIRMYYAD
ncbi:MAG: NAD-dependent epimerase/dehydratase family protein [Saprospiraceae bacterium]|nr:NAD-dependent epimerase/dehydratase family protein [Saprospiraceae bacterium]